MKEKSQKTLKVKKEKVEKVKKRKKLRGKGAFNIFKVNGEFKLIPLIINILIPVVGGAIVAYLNRGGISTYETLKKPFFNPPDIVFQVVWTILYILMGIAAYRIFMKNRQGVDDKGGYFYYLVQLMINFLWTFIFFTFRLYGVSFIVIVILFILIVITLIKFIKVDKIAGILLIPYLIWVFFAGILNLFIWILNEM